MKDLTITGTGDARIIRVTDHDHQQVTHLTPGSGVIITDHITGQQIKVTGTPTGPTTRTP